MTRNIFNPFRSDTIYYTKLPNNSHTGFNSHKNKDFCTCCRRKRVLPILFLYTICLVTLVFVLYSGEFILSQKKTLTVTNIQQILVLENDEVSNSISKDDENSSSSSDEAQNDEAQPSFMFKVINVTTESAKYLWSTEKFETRNGSNEKQENVFAPKLEIQSVVKPEEVSCHLPQLKPFDETILKYYQVPKKKLDCTQKYHRPVLFASDLYSNLITMKDPSEYKLSNCYYKLIERKNENKATLSKTNYPIKKKIMPIQPEHEFIAIYCMSNDTKNSNGTKTKSKLSDMHNFVHEKSKRLIPHLNTSHNDNTKNNSKEKPLNQVHDKLNIVMIGIDAVSHMNFIRTMPQTYNYIKHNLSSNTFGMNGFTKVGDNTFPNVVPILTGLNVNELSDTCWTDYFDDCPFIWKNFSESANYITSYAEDEEWMSAFNYGKSGFKIQPTHYYLRPFTFLLEKKLGHKSTSNAKLCYGPRTGFSILLHHIQKLAFTMLKAERNFFSFTWSNSLSHDELNYPTYGDEDLFMLMKWFKESKNTTIANNTLIILLSDHGIRWGDIRTTFQGRIEERMPFLYFTFPDWFIKKYSLAIANLKLNENRLTTPFDLHATLLDLLDLVNNISNDNLKSRVQKQSQLLESQQLIPRGISLFTPIPLRRNCSDAEIENHWCVCHNMENIPNPSNNSKIIEATKVIMKDLNQMLIKFPQCSQLTLKQILNAQELVQPSIINNIETEEDEYNGNEDDERTTPDALFYAEAETTISPSNYDEEQEDIINNQVPSKFTITFKVKPSNAIFEASVVKENENTNWKLSGDISRINLYGTQSHCVKEYKMKKYCFCTT